ncbi:MAG: hypothetical protein Q8N23_35000 [Archangium sp.]|nr:hypothetical protein [Archangium sp.]MDP3157932.1 hypothetical protein [Archangium sp.]MDP3572118.1 hypothetical protein [Archangium sp.]
MAIEEFVRQVPEFEGWGHTQRIRFIGWYYHALDARPDYEVGEFRRAYERLNLTPPSNISQLVTQLVEQKQLIRKAKKLSLDRRLRLEFDAKYGQRPTAISVTKLLQELPAKVPHVAERAFLDETIKCFGAGAYRAAIVMSWNLAYDHLLQWVLKNHLAAFNAAWPTTFKKPFVVFNREDFADAKEAHIIQVCRAAGFIGADLKKMLDEKLDKRNSAAHPSAIVFGQAQAEAHIDDLVQNVVLKLL